MWSIAPGPIAMWSAPGPGINVPIANMLHHYVITEPLQELIDLEQELPVVRDPYSRTLICARRPTAS